ncbi:MAG: hypothetical protein HY828_07895 [Actinobacteria bacterium]|nr:hypothetical protein [Actinomycetota bacterium]
MSHRRRSRQSRLVLAIAFAATCLTACFDSRNQECLPYEQFRLDGVVYWGPSDPLDPSKLGEEVGEITTGLPDSAADCVPFTLKDGQGTATPGSKVYAVNGVDPQDALAVVERSTGAPRIYRTRATPP